MKSVLVVGAGPAGLVVAKTLLQHGGGKHYNVTVFEAAERVGGMWRAEETEEGDKCSPHMKTNLSRFTVAFSDLSWHSIKFGDEYNKDGVKSTPSTPPPMFPKAWQVGRYLQEYANKFIPNGTIFCDREVTKADLVESEPRRWSVSSFDKASKVAHNHDFDHLIVASGFFNQPYSSVSKSVKGDAPYSNMRHSAKFRHVSSLTTNAGNIVVIGGGISGSEAATAAAFQVSNAKYAPGANPTWADSKIVHVVNRPFYALPRYLPQEPYNPAKQDFHLAPHFLPLDLVLYSLSRRGEGQISASNGKVAPEKAEKSHGFIRSCIGGDQRDLGRSELVYRQEHVQFPSYTGISDMYSEFVRSGLIIVKQGYSVGIAQQVESDTESNNSDSLEIGVMPKAPWSIIHEKNHPLSKIQQQAVAVIEATGFRAEVKYLSEAVKTDLQFDPNSNRLPFLLGRGSIFNDKNDLGKKIAFVGFYEGPYWGVMEAQAQLIAETWASQNSPPTDISSEFFLPDEQQISLRNSMNMRELDIPQFWMSDYVGLMEEIFREAGIERNDTGFGGQYGPTVPARYVGPTCDKEEANKVLSDVGNVLRDSLKGRFAAAATFRGMQGDWVLDRKIDSRLASMPGGVFKGTAQFHPRIPTDAAYTAEYLYIEEGTLKMDNSYTFPATRRYIYRYNEVTDTITAWFTANDGESTGSFFNKWEYEAPKDAEHGWIAKGSHYCEPDTYKNSCEFRFRGASLATFGITYEATGPNKDYTHESWYQRPVNVDRG